MSNAYRIASICLSLVTCLCFFQAVGANGSEKNVILLGIDGLHIGMTKATADESESKSTRIAVRQSEDCSDFSRWSYRADGYGVIGNPNIGPEVWLSSDKRIVMVRGMPLNLNGKTILPGERISALLAILGTPDSMLPIKMAGDRNDVSKFRRLVFEKYALEVSVVVTGDEIKDATLFWAQIGGLNKN